MQGIVSIIESNLAERIEKIWEEVKGKFDINSVEPLIPHFSWSVAEYFVINFMKNSIEESMNKFHKFTVSITGLAVFPGPDTIYYLPLVVSHELLDIHKDIWSLITKNQNKIKKLNNNYKPGNWVPHITVIHQKGLDYSRKNFFEILEPLIDTYKTEISNISLIDNDGNVYFKLNF
ncbi:MAG: 2'-5' RNA ligase family protein [Candidatus Hodarchaeales archaeon]|jgi:2'-5' RNA ligase